MHEPQFLESAGKAAIVVFIHGFMGSPRQFDRLAKVAHDNGFSTMSLLLPGHGSNLKDFSNTTLENWADHVNIEIGRLSTAYSRIFIVGHSMGCLLAINTSLKYRENVYGLFLIYCPFKMGYLSIAAIRTRMRRIFYKKTNPIKSAYRTACSVQLSPSIIWRFIKPTIELRKLIAITIDNLQHLHIPATAIYSSSDEVVSTSSLDILEQGSKHTSIKSILLSNSQHAYFTEEEQAVIENALLNAIDLCQNH
jgi:carboxylesterase